MATVSRRMFVYVTGGLLDDSAVVRTNLNGFMRFKRVNRTALPLIQLACKDGVIHYATRHGVFPWDGSGISGLPMLDPSAALYVQSRNWTCNRRLVCSSLNENRTVQVAAFDNCTGWFYSPQAGWIKGPERGGALAAEPPTYTLTGDNFNGRCSIWQRQQVFAAREYLASQAPRSDLFVSNAPLVDVLYLLRADALRDAGIAAHTPVTRILLQMSQRTWLNFYDFSVSVASIDLDTAPSITEVLQRMQLGLVAFADTGAPPFMASDALLPLCESRLRALGVPTGQGVVEQCGIRPVVISCAAPECVCARMCVACVRMRSSSTQV